jgi:hypothetical protein
VDGGFESELELDWDLALPVPVFAFESAALFDLAFGAGWVDVL